VLPLFEISASVGIDLGTANSLVYVKGKGIVLREPSVVAVDKNTGEVLAVGTEAQLMIGRTPENILAIRPLKDGVISDFNMTEEMIRQFLDKVIGRSFWFKPRVMICIPAEITPVELRAIQEAGEQAGAKRVTTIEEPLAAAIGAGLPVEEPTGNMVIDIGGGTCDIAVISLGGIVCSESIRIAGNRFDSEIETFIKREHHLMIGERTAENIKMTIGAAYPGARNLDMEVRGRDLVTGMPQNITVTTDEIVQALRESVSRIIECVRRVLDKTPPELSADILDRGIILTGGGSLLYGLDELIRRETGGIPTMIADDPLSCVAIGIGKALENAKNF
jgi:rod shape-determining protein MreB